MRFYAHIFFDLEHLLEIQQIRQKIIQLLPYEIDVGDIILEPQAPMPKPMLRLAYQSIYQDSVKTILKRLCSEYSVMFHPYVDDQILNFEGLGEWLGPALHLEAQI